MNKVFSRPKKFSEILDLTFQVIKRNFSSLFLISLIFIGPITIFQALIQTLAGRSFFRNIESGENFFDTILSTYEFETLMVQPIELIGNVFISIAETAFYPVMIAAIIILVKRVKDQDSFTVKSIVKQAFTRFWPLLGSTLLFSLIIFALIFFPLLIILPLGMITVISDPLSGGILLFLLVVGGGIGLALLLTKWAFFLPALVFDQVAPGLSKSWRLTKGRTWMSLWLLVTLFIIRFVVNVAFETPAMFLGTSVLYFMIVNLVSILSMMIFYVGYAVVYFDLDVRQSGSDLTDMIDDYNTNQNHIDEPIER